MRRINKVTFDRKWWRQQKRKEVFDKFAFLKLRIQRLQEQYAWLVSLRERQTARLKAEEERDEAGAIRERGAGDVKEAARLVAQSQGIRKAREAAENHCRLAIKAVDSFPTALTKDADVCRNALRFLATSVLGREK